MVPLSNCRNFVLYIRVLWFKYENIFCSIPVLYLNPDFLMAQQILEQAKIEVIQKYVGHREELLLTRTIGAP